MHACTYINALIAALLCGGGGGGAGISLANVKADLINYTYMGVVFFFFFLLRMCAAAVE